MELAYIDHYDSFTFNLIDWLTGGLPALTVHYIPFDDARKMQWVKGEKIPLVFSPGPKSPEEAQSSVDLVRATIGRRPILGVCLGHQILGRVAGSHLERSRSPLHGGCRNLRILDNQGFLRNVNLEAVAAYNSLTVAHQGLSPSFRITAICQAGEVQVIESDHAEGYRSFGVQFHPESFLSRGTEGLRENWRREILAYYQNQEQLPLLSNPRIPATSV